MSFEQLGRGPLQRVLAKLDAARKKTVVFGGDLPNAVDGVKCGGERTLATATKTKARRNDQASNLF